MTITELLPHYIMSPCHVGPVLPAVWSDSIYFLTGLGSRQIFFRLRLRLLVFFQSALAPHFFQPAPAPHFFFNRLPVFFRRLRYVCVSGV